MPTSPWRFQAVEAPASVLLEALAASAPANPMATPEYADAMRQLGRTAWYLEVRLGTEVLGCLGFSRGRRFRPGTFEIPSLPPLPPEAIPPFYAGVLAQARRCGAWDLRLDSFGSPAAVIPPLARATARRARTEFVAQLHSPVGLAALSTGHKRNTAKARRSGIIVSRTSDPAAVPGHVQLMAASMDRRAARGERVASTTDRQVLEISAYVRSGLAELFQARDGETVLSSICVLRAREGAYYQSAGTTPAGMHIGASHFLITEVAARLAAEGLRQFNLGGAGEESPGLQRFKAGFGASGVSLEAAVVTLASPGQRLMRRVARLMRFGRA